MASGVMHGTPNRYLNIHVRHPVALIHDIHTGQTGPLFPEMPHPTIWGKDVISLLPIRHSLRFDTEKPIKPLR